MVFPATADCCGDQGANQSHGAPARVDDVVSFPRLGFTTVVPLCRWLQQRGGADCGRVEGQQLRLPERWTAALA